MPEYLHPGVYVVEVEGGVRPIEGVSTSTANLVNPILVARLQAIAGKLSPDWTDYNDNDPGLALLDLAAWLSEAVLYGMKRTPEGAAGPAARLAAVALRALQDSDPPKGSAVRKVRFYESAAVATDGPEQDCERDGESVWIRCP
jgi:hypothetical protein